MTITQSELARRRRRVYLNAAWIMYAIAEKKRVRDIEFRSNNFMNKI